MFLVSGSFSYMVPTIPVHPSTDVQNGYLDGRKPDASAPINRSTCSNAEAANGLDRQQYTKSVNWCTPDTSSFADLKLDKIPECGPYTRTQLSVQHHKRPPSGCCRAQGIANFMFVNREFYVRDHTMSRILGMGRVKPSPVKRVNTPGTDL